MYPDRTQRHLTRHCSRHRTGPFNRSMVQSGGERCRPRATGWPCSVRLSAQTLGCA